MTGVEFGREAEYTETRPVHTFGLSLSLNSLAGCVNECNPYPSKKVWEVFKINDS